MRLLRRVTAWRFTLVSVILLTVEYAYLGIIIAKVSFFRLNVTNFEKIFDKHRTH